MPCLRTPSTSSIPNAFDPTQLSSLKYSGVYSQLVGAVHARLHDRAVRLQQADADLERLLLRDGVVHHVDAAGERHREPGRATRSTPPDHFAASSITASAGSWREHLVRAELAASVGLRAEARDDADLDVGVERAQDRDRARAERTGAVDEHLAAGRRRVPRDRVQRHRERVGEHRDLVGDRVGHREQHRRVRGHEVRPAAGDVARRADVDAGRERRASGSSSRG